MPKVLVFGSNGFVGGYLAKEFSSCGYQVMGCDRGETSRYVSVTQYESVDVCDAFCVESVIERSKPDAIVNLAAISSVSQSWSMPAAAFQVNVVGAINIFEAMRKHCPDSKILIVGSSEEYAASDDPLTEESPIDASSPYGISKIAQENIAEVYTKRFDLKVYRTRSFNHIGVGQAPNFVIPSWCQQAAEISRSGKPGVMKIGNLSVYRDFSDVRDVVRAYRMLIESDFSGEVFNIGAGKSYPLSEILEVIVSMSEQSIDVMVDPSLLRPVDNERICSDCSKARRCFGWEPQIDITDSLSAVFESYSNLNACC
ncbi:GDP-mannose 4,6-dehydratase [Adlercreutzia sp. ZJ141]|uniref:GDP-mannose 4,6-dehydratase n=1 Tax=Adlercreutzia sp. ZJ141 TaxID=2709406 RepID=UPI0013EACCE4|nr:GDP-mannose 4,6-dehydratase [Adlercreutzia sp. ZJ141]